MSTTLILLAAFLAGVATYLVTSRILSRILLGFVIYGHVVVIALLAAGGKAGEAPLADQTSAIDSSDPLPQALSLTAIVISFGLTLFMLALARASQLHTGTDLVEDDLEDKSIGLEESHG